MVRDEVFHILVALGLTRLQAEVYLTLLEARETDVQTISWQTKLPWLDVKQALYELEKLGFIKEVIPFLDNSTHSEAKRKCVDECALVNSPRVCSKRVLSIFLLFCVQAKV
jgi:hypothetical protein